MFRMYLYVSGQVGAAISQTLRYNGEQAKRIGRRECTDMTSLAGGRRKPVNSLSDRRKPVNCLIDRRKSVNSLSDRRKPVNCLCC